MSYLRFRIYAVVMLVFAVASLRAAIVVGPGGEPLSDVRVVSENVNVRIDHPVARTEFRMVLHNNLPRDAEAIVLLPVPEDAQVSDMVLTVNGQSLAAEVLERTEAADLYASIVRKMRDPMLLEYLDERTVRARVYPIPAGGDAEILLEYLQTVKQKGGLYAWHFDSLMPRNADEAKISFSIQLRAKGGISTAISPTHEIAVADAADGMDIGVPNYNTSGGFVLLYQPTDANGTMHLMTYRMKGSEEGTFLLMLTPPRDEKQSALLPKDVVFVLDVSGSMSDEGKMEKARGALNQCIHALGHDDRFQVITFSTSVNRVSDGLLTASDDNIDTAAKWIDAIRPRGGTNIHDGLAAAKELLMGHPPEDKRARQIILMTDGLPTVGKTDDVQIAAVMKDAGGDLRAFTVGFGYDVNAPLLDEIASEGRGVSDYIAPGENIETAVAALFEAISQPVLTNLSIRFDGIDVTEMYPNRIPDMFAGRNLMILGTYHNAGKAEITLTGDAAGGAYEETVNGEFPEATSDDYRNIRALYAKRKVAALLDEIRRNGENEELREEVVALAREFRIVTPYTSFLAAPDADYAITGATSAPRRGTPMAIARGESASAPSAAPIGGAVARQKSGRAAVEFSQQINELREAEVAVTSDSAAMPAGDSPDVYIRGRHFHRTSGVWIEQVEAKPETVHEIEMMSDTYLELAKTHPEVREILALGDKIEFKLGDAWIVIK